MKEEELKAIVSNLKTYTNNTLVTEMKIQGIGIIEIEVELNVESEINSKRLNTIIDFVRINHDELNTKSNVLLNSLAKTKELSSFKHNPTINFDLVGVWICNDESIHNQFKLIYNYNSEMIHMNEDTLGYRTVNISGSSPNYYISGVNWMY